MFVNDYIEHYLMNEAEKNEERENMIGCRVVIVFAAADNVESALLLCFPDS